MLKRGLRYCLFLSLGTMLSLFSYLAYLSYDFAFRPFSKDAPITFILEQGKSFQYFVEELTSAGYIKHPQFFLFLGKMVKAQKKIRSGEYEMNPKDTPKDLLDKILRGQVKYHPITLVEGKSFRQFKLELSQQPFLKHDLIEVSDEELAKRLGIKEDKLEGWLFPETYFVTYGTKETAIIEQAHHLMKQKLHVLWENKSNTAFYSTPYQALIVASLVEKETALENERPLVATVILNRLKKGMRLQIDPTVIYGLGAEYTGKLTLTNLKKDTPYNTYLHNGLPPTPIAMPSLSAIQAALNPATADLLYFVAQGDGSHYFSCDLKTHHEAVNKYRNKMKEKHEKTR